jgi:hypothetical protein
MKTIKFISMGEAVSDFEISKYVDKIFASSENEFHTSTHLVINEIRARVAEGFLKTKDFKIWVEDVDGEEVVFVVDKDGRGKNWQPTQEVSTDILDRLIKF